MFKPVVINFAVELLQGLESDMLLSFKKTLMHLILSVKDEDF